MRHLLIGVIAVTACAGPAAISAGDIQISTIEAMKACESVGVIEERVESPAQNETLAEEIRAEVRKRAAKLHATHLVFTAEEADASYAFAKAQAYRCKR